MRNAAASEVGSHALRKRGAAHRPLLLAGDGTECRDLLPRSLSSMREGITEVRFVRQSFSDGFIWAAFLAFCSREKVVLVPQDTIWECVERLEGWFVKRTPWFSGCVGR